MTKITYTSDGDADEVKAFGVKFMDGKPVEVSDEVAAKLKGNPFFKAASEKATTDKAPASPAKATKATDKAPEQPADADASFKAPFEAKDEENGWWNVYDADGKKVKALRKDDAEIFNSLSDDDKAKQVETFSAA